MNDFEIILVHGTGGHNADWFPALTQELNKRGISYQLPQLATKPPIQVEEWLRGVHNVVNSATKPIVFIGYSLGTRAILLYLEKHNVNMKHIFFIAAFSHKSHPGAEDSNKYSSFFKHDIDTNPIKNQTKNITILHSKDDDIIPYQQAMELSEELNADLITYQGKGHFYQPEDVEDILLVLEKKLSI